MQVAATQQPLVSGRGHSFGSASSKTLEIDLKFLPKIKEYLDSVLKCDERTLRTRLSELEGEKWTVAQWNLAGISARTMLLGHPAYSAVLQVVQRHGGF